MGSRTRRQSGGLFHEIDRSLQGDRKRDRNREELPELLRLRRLVHALPPERADPKRGEEAPHDGGRNLRPPTHLRRARRGLSRNARSCERPVMQHPKLYIARTADDVPVPAYQSKGAAGLDLAAAVDAPVVI